MADEHDSDASCATVGDYIPARASPGIWDIGVDSSPDMLARARWRVPDGEFGVAELDRLPLPDDCADVIVCALALVHVPACTRYWPSSPACCASAVRPAGTAARGAGSRPAGRAGRCPRPRPGSAAGETDRGR
jgi:SAM-dependent methyltransferase